jgi:hypothetical protein
MSQYIPELDDPFDTIMQEDSEDEGPVIELVPSIPPSACIVNSPVGDEIVSFADLEEPTRVFNQVELAALIADSCPHRHATVPSFHAVKVP